MKPKVKAINIKTHPILVSEKILFLEEIVFFSGIIFFVFLLKLRV